MAQRLVRVILYKLHQAQEIFSRELKEAGLDPVAWGNVTFAEGAGA